MDKLKKWFGRLVDRYLDDFSILRKIAGLEE